jgi:hypothetical protein
MGYTFTYAPHPAPDRALSPASTQDPHALPVFDSRSLNSPDAPVLYLPPLLSSLPKTFPPRPTAPSEHAPLVTETRLPDIDPVSLSLHKALHRFQPLNAEYAVAPYARAFNWGDLELPEEEEREWYCVVFRSKRKAGSDGGRSWGFARVAVGVCLPMCLTALYAADRMAHEEAVRNGGVSDVCFHSPHILLLCALAYHVLVRNTECGVWAKSRDVHLAVAKTRDSG